MVLYLESRFTTVRRLVQMTKEDAKTLVLYQTEDGAVTLEVSVEDDTVWLTQMQMAERFKEIFPLFPGILRRYLLPDSFAPPSYRAGIS